MCTRTIIEDTLSADISKEVKKQEIITWNILSGGKMVLIMKCKQNWIIPFDTVSMFSRWVCVISWKGTIGVVFW